MKNGPMKAKRVVVASCEEHARVHLIFRDGNGADLAHAILDAATAFDVAAQIQERASALEQSRPTAGHA